MMRKTAASSMQKTYDECFLICSTAIYFEGQNNEAEALRAWRNALDQIYYHNAYKMPSTWVPKSETEKALQDSLQKMEMQCKERVDLLDALKQSREEAPEEAKKDDVGGTAEQSHSRESLASIRPASSSGQSSATWLGNDTIPQASYADIPRPQPAPERRPAPPSRPSYVSKNSSDDMPRSRTLHPNRPLSGSPRLTTPTNDIQRARTPSPEKKNGGMLRTLRSNPKDKPASGKLHTSFRNRPPQAAARAATQVWSGPPSRASVSSQESSSNVVSGSSGTAWDPYTRSLVDRSRPPVARQQVRRVSDNPVARTSSPLESAQARQSVGFYEGLGNSNTHPPPYPEYPIMNPFSQAAFNHSDESVQTEKAPPVPPPHNAGSSKVPDQPRHQPQPQSLQQIGSASISYMKEYPNNPPLKPKKVPPPIPTKPADRTSDSDGPSKAASPKPAQARSSPGIPRKAVASRAAGIVSAIAERQKLENTQMQLQERVRADPQVDLNNSGPNPGSRKGATKRKIEGKPVLSRAITPPTTDDSPDSDVDNHAANAQQEAWEQRVKQIMKKLPKGVDEAAAKQIFNEIVIQGDEVHWEDVAGLEIAKSALKETVVYPFLRPDLFMGLREPARGMLLFGPPGTGKTMLARAVATESKSVFFAISASSLTSKFLGESEKLVRALFCLAKELAPSIIFVDEIDSLLGSRGGSSEHEATRRIKTEFLIQWSDLQKAAAGREAKPDEGDATRVLVLAATNLPWAIDEAARRRFVRRQYIPLPEDWVREKQLRTLLSAQKHSINDRDLEALVEVTDGYSGSDITALAKDAAMGPLRSLGEKLLHMSPDEIRPIGMQDFQSSLVNIRPSVSKQGLKEFEDWAREFGERGG